MAHSTCPSCDARLNVGANPKMGQRMTCHFCKTELEVAWLNPIELDWPFDSDEEDEYYYADQGAYSESEEW